MLMILETSTPSHVRRGRWSRVTRGGPAGFYASFSICPERRFGGVLNWIPERSRPAATERSAIAGFEEFQILRWTAIGASYDVREARRSRSQEWPDSEIFGISGPNVGSDEARDR